MYQDSEGVNLDYAKAATLYTKACSGGSSNGCSDLGELYRRGLGVPKDAEKARTYLSKGCDMGNQYGCQHMKLIQ
jgi:TPR repeat protein